MRVRRSGWLRRPIDTTAPRRPSMVGQMAPDVTGTSPGGSPLVLSFGARPDGSEAVPVSAALFLTSSCEPCLGLWTGAPVGTDGVGAAVAAVAVVAVVAVVTPDAATEDARKVARLAPAGLPVVMSSRGWHDYGVTGAPWLVVVDDRGVVVFDGPAPATWAAIRSVLAGA